MNKNAPQTEQSPLDVAIDEAGLAICIIGAAIGKRGKLTMPENNRVRRQLQGLHNLLREVALVIKHENIYEYRRRLNQEARALPRK